MSEFVARVSNPILRWLAEHGWEDPGWGNMAMYQVTVGLALHEISTKIADRELQGQIQAIAQKIVLENAQQVVR